MSTVTVDRSSFTAPAVREKAPDGWTFGTLVSDVCFYTVDRLWFSPPLAPDYVTRFTKRTSPDTLTPP